MYNFIEGLREAFKKISIVVLAPRSRINEFEKRREEGGLSSGSDNRRATPSSS